MDRQTWMYGLQRDSGVYLDYLKDFLKAAEDHRINKGESHIWCPCKKCQNCKKFNDSGVIEEHLICDGFMSRYTRWSRHGELLIDRNMVDTGCNDEETEDYDNENYDHLDDMLHDIQDNVPDKYHEAFQQLFDDAEKPLYAGCTRFTKLSAVLKLFNLKANNGWSDKSFTNLLEFLHELLPEDNELPDSLYRAKKLVCPMGLEIERIHACPNDCMIYWDQNANLDKCITCGTSRYKQKNQAEEDDNVKKKLPAAKVFWYLSIIERLKRLFANAKDAQLLRWHAEQRKRDGKLRHVADSPQWRNIDDEFKEFGDEIRNIRFGLSSDGINPFGNMSSQHSTWPVLLCVYNLPPWLCMKRKYIMMPLLIQGPKQPGNNIDVYLAPLVEDLKKLWNSGVEVYDAYKKQYFQLHAMIFCTISDFPAYANLSGYSTKGKKACPVCENDTQSLWLKECKKHVYMGHRRSLPINHEYRKQGQLFDGKEENDRLTQPMNGIAAFSRVQNLNIIFGKGVKNNQHDNWKKRSIFWELPYWKKLEVRHCLDVMHIEKNVCESLIALLLHISGKSKDGIRVRRDMVLMGIRPELAPIDKGKNRAYLPPACYTMSKDEKNKFCECLHGVKVPSGYSSNVKRLVSMKDLKLIGVKSHDYHVLITHIIPIAIRGILPDHIRHAITKLCLFFNMIHSKVIDPEILDSWQNDIIITLCQLEMYFPPSFFDVMVHLVSHIVREIKICGPVFLRYMYPFERYMGFLKGHVRNRHRPDASIVEGYATEEVIEFCTNYLEGVPTIGIPQSRHEGRLEGVGISGFNVIKPDREAFHLAHFTVLQHMTVVSRYINEHMEMLRRTYSRRTQKWLANKHMGTFPQWLKNKVKESLGTVDPLVKLLAYGPLNAVSTYQSYDINGYTFYTENNDKKSTLQNSGVTLIAISNEYSNATHEGRSIIAKDSYYGIIQEIWELKYDSSTIVPLFKCKWVDNQQGVIVDDDGFTLVNLSKEGYATEPFILAKQANQIFFVEDPKDSEWHVVLHGKRRILGVENVVDEEEYDQFDELPPFSIGIPSSDVNIDNTGYLRSDHNEGVYCRSTQ